jgi:hypothetical protein
VSSGQIADGDVIVRTAKGENRSQHSVSMVWMESPILLVAQVIFSTASTIDADVGSLAPAFAAAQDDVDVEDASDMV